jgi:hypothetical protein
MVLTCAYPGDLRVPKPLTRTRAGSPNPYPSDPTHALPAGAYPWVTQAIATRAGPYDRGTRRGDIRIPPFWVTYVTPADDIIDASMSSAPRGPFLSQHHEIYVSFHTAHLEAALAKSATHPFAALTDLASVIAR